MTEPTQWQDAVKVVRAAEVDAAKASGSGRATLFNFIGAGAGKTWIGEVRMAPGAKTGGHHHGHTEVALYVLSGNVEISWGDKLEHSAELEAGDCAYFPPGVPHQEHNRSATEAVDFIAIRSDGERIVVKLD